MAAKKQRKTKVKEIIGGDVEGASQDELNTKIHILEQEKNKEEQFRNYMQLERDKINQFWEINKNALENCQAKVRNKDREIEEMIERHQVEMKVYKQKVKHLLYEHQTSMVNIKMDNQVVLKLQQEEFQSQHQATLNDKRSIQQELKEQGLAQQDVVRQLSQDHLKELTKHRQEFELAIKQLRNSYEKKMKILKQELELQKKQEIMEVEERKNQHISELMVKHERAFSEIKNYYNDITHNNLDLIKTLKEDVTNMKKKEAQNEKLMYEIAQENKHLSEPLSKALKEVEQLRSQLCGCERDKISMTQTKSRLCQYEKQCKNLQWENEVVMNKLYKVEDNRNLLQNKFESSTFQSEQHSQLKQNILEKKQKESHYLLDKTRAQMAELIACSGQNQNNFLQEGQNINKLLDEKNGVINVLSDDVVKVIKSYNDLINIYEAKLQELGLSTDDLKLKSLQTQTSLEFAH